MAEVGAAFVAGDFGSAHAKAAVNVLVDQFFIVRRMKAWPAAAGVELRFRAEKRGGATQAAVGAGIVGVPVHAGECRLGAFLAGDAVFGRGQFSAPFGVGFFDFWHAGLDSWLAVSSRTPILGNNSSSMTRIKRHEPDPPQ